MSEDIHKYPSQTADRFQVRMPDGLRDRIAEAAKANGRSMNTEIVHRLESSFGLGGKLTPDEVIEIIKRISVETGLQITIGIPSADLAALDKVIPQKPKRGDAR